MATYYLICDSDSATQLLWETLKSYTATYNQCGDNPPSLFEREQGRIRYDIVEILFPSFAEMFAIF
jgi:hypothetical protein